MAASDYMVGNAPQGASYAAPLVGQQIGQQIAGMPADYMQGRQFARQRALQDAFPNGIPTRPDGSPDTGAIMSTMGRIGGGEYIQGLMPYLLQMEGARNAGAAMRGADSVANGGGSQPAGMRDAPAASGPGNVTARPQAPPVASPQGPQGSQPMSSTGMDNNGGGDTIRTLATAAGRGKDMTNAIGTISRTYQLNPDAPLQPDQVQRVNTFLANRVGADAKGQNANQKPTPPTQDQTDSDYPLAKLATPEAVKNLDKAIAILRASALQASASGNKPLQEVMEKRAEDYQKRRDQYVDYMQKSEQATYEHELRNQDLTNEEKNARNPTVLAAKKEEEWNKQDVDRYSKQATGIDAQAAAADSMRAHLQLAKGIFNNPQFYSGTGEGINLAYKRAIAAFGGDPNASLPQEAFRKIMAANILDQVANLKAETAASGGATRIFQSQIQLMEKAAQNPDNSIAANRLLTEIGIRLADRATQIADLKAAYKNGHIDSRFNSQLRLWNRDHPVFSPDELQHLDRIAPPEFSTFKDAYNAKLKPGSPVKVNGELRFAQEPK